VTAGVGYLFTSVFAPCGAAAMPRLNSAELWQQQELGQLSPLARSMAPPATEAGRRSPKLGLLVTNGSCQELRPGTLWPAACSVPQQACSRPFHLLARLSGMMLLPAKRQPRCSWGSHRQHSERRMRFAATRLSGMMLLPAKHQPHCSWGSHRQHSERRMRVAATVPPRA